MNMIERDFQEAFSIVIEMLKVIVGVFIVGCGILGLATFLLVAQKGAF